MITIFREVEQAYSSVTIRDNVEKRLKVLDLLSDYISSGLWWESSRVNEICTYWKLSQRDYARVTGKEYVNVRSILTRASTRLRDKIGYNNVSLILDGNMEEVDKVEFKLRTLLSSNNNIDNIINKNTLEKVGTKTVIHNDYTLKQLKSELAFLDKHSVSTMEKEIKEIDMKKLGFIIGVLQSKEGEFIDLKCDILSILQK